jgi:hypothetical protein
MACCPYRVQCLVNGSADLIRWGRHSVWERVLNLVQEKDVRLGMAPGRQQHSRPPEGAGEAKEDLDPDAMCVRLLADHVAAVAPRPA